MVWWANIETDLDDELFDDASLWTVLWLDHGSIHIRYMIVRKSDHLPLFDERFINYGYNKQQWVEHLRYIGYKFAQLVQGYGIDIPHPSAIFFSKFIYSIELMINMNYYEIRLSLYCYYCIPFIILI